MRRPHHIALFLAATWLLTACTGDLTDTNTAKDDAGCIAFTTGVEEVADVLYEMGKTRSADGSVLNEELSEANTARSIRLEGSDELYVHRMPLPLVGIHPKTAKGSFQDNQTVHTPNNRTRAPLSEIAGGGIAFHDSLSIWGFTDKGRQLLNGTLLRKVNGWRSHVHWPYDEEDVAAAYLNPTTMKFYAIAPALESLPDLKIKNAGTIGYTSSPAKDEGPQFDYTVPAAVDEQRDLLYGESTATTATDDNTWAAVSIPNGPAGSHTDDPRTENLGEDNKVVKMKFRHILTAIRFAQGKMPVGVQVKEIKLVGVKNKGTYNARAWSGQEGSADYTVSVSKNIAAYEENVYIDGDNVLFLMPQTFPANSTAALHIKIAIGNAEHTLKGSLKNDVWAAGHTVTYKVTVGEMSDSYYLVVDTGDTGQEKTTPQNNSTGTVTKYTQGSESIEHNDATAHRFTIHSFRNYKDYASSATGTNRWHDAGWKVAGYADTKEGTYAYDNPSAGYVSDIKIGGSSIKDGNTSHTTGGTQTIDCTMASQAAVNTTSATNNHLTILVENTPVTNKMNLSTHLPDGTTSGGFLMTGAGSGLYDIYQSANSYIVNAEGTYIFPIVYGCAYNKSGTPNFTPSATFTDHARYQINHANILEQVNSYLNNSLPPATDETLTSGTEYNEGARKKTTTITSYKYKSSNLSTNLIWQDVDDVFTVPTIEMSPTTDDIGFISFGVTSSPQPGNCLIALKGRKSTIATIRLYDESGTEITGNVGGITYPRTDVETLGDDEILWTWHIWCTDEVYPNKNTETVDVNYPQYANGTKIISLRDASDVETGKILPVNLGWVPDDMEWNRYEPREVWVKIEQTVPAEGEKQVAYIKLRKEAKQDCITGSSMLYQWGRPSPLNMTANSPAPAMQADLGGNNAYWAATKTLYDPCPPDFQVPAASVFTGFSLTGAGTDGTNFNMWDGCFTVGTGGFFFAKQHSAPIPSSDHYGTQVYMPATGYWNGSSMTDTGKGYFWTYGTASSTTATSLQINPQKNSSGSISFTSTSNTVNALPIRPCGSN